MADLPFTYDDESKVDESIECPICYCPLIDPVEHSSYQSQCVHMFCRACVGKLDKCPFCRMAVEKWEAVALTPSTQRFIFGPLAELKVTCSSCTMPTTRKEIVKHVETCGIKLPSGFVPVAVNTHAANNTNNANNGQGFIQQIGSTTRNIIQSFRGTGQNQNNQNNNQNNNNNNNPTTNNNQNNQQQQQQLPDTNAINNGNNNDGNQHMTIQQIPIQQQQQQPQQIPIQQPQQQIPPYLQQPQQQIPPYQQQPYQQQQQQQQQIPSAPRYIQGQSFNDHNSVTVQSQSIVPSTVVPISSIYTAPQMNNPVYSPYTPYSPYGHANSRTYNTYYGGGSAMGGVGYSSNYPPPPSSIYVAPPAHLQQQQQQSVYTPNNINNYGTGKPSYPPPPVYSFHNTAAQTSAFNNPSQMQSSVFMAPSLPSHLSFDTSLALSATASLMPEPPKTFSPKTIEYAGQVYLEGEVLANRKFNGSLFSGIEMKHCNIVAAQFVNCFFENCQFDTCDFQQSIFIDCVFDSCTLSLCNMSMSEHQNTYFHLCTTGETNMFGIKTSKLNFGNCTLNSTNFAQAQLAGALFQTSYLTNCNFSSAHMYNTDLSSSKQISCLFKDANYNPTILINNNSHITGNNINSDGSVISSVNNNPSMVHHINLNSNPSPQPTALKYTFK
ncbi:hypothetical protein DFA_10245 [Cavenderia fasciculata]|uniref:RING-type domain-containing protein n=1 Tax=Cavenderia fasciculata TaxID=261658 RepID=F4Q9P1_CACFS|nr:uncharacterized protein DFA_10245 [Cavenderia fasciculata]EGG15410.1 hypothetical protein DFA_10245 [Cavenderia fasciculata]|eukprot:XP_004354152.1 hypothetical protein DFA_10245 [Cavenderia fasciculata]